MINLVIPFIFQLGFATISLDDGHKIRSSYVRSGTVSPSSGFLISIGDMSDIQTSLHGNSCLIRVSEIKSRFELEVKSTVDRCDKRLDVFRKSLTESQLLNKNLKEKLGKEEVYSNRLLIVSSAVVGVLATSTLYLSLR